MSFKWRYREGIRAKQVVWISRNKLLLQRRELGRCFQKSLEQRTIFGCGNHFADGRTAASLASPHMEADAASPLQKWCEWGEQAQTLP